MAETTHISHSPLIVWNCPRTGEISPVRAPIPAETLKLLYHGSIVPDRLPLAILDALASLPAGVTLTVVGYETVGSAGYVERMRGRAAELGISQRVEFAGTLATREELMSVCRRHDAGLALMPASSSDLNLRHMEGASNKPFDYLACGLALIVSRLPEWERIFVEPGYALSCDAASAESLARVIGSMYRHPEETRAMGERGRGRVIAEWNYEHQFRPVKQLISGEAACAAQAMAEAAR